MNLKNLHAEKIQNRNFLFKCARWTKERLEALRTIRGMWKGKGQEIMKRIEVGREDRNMSPAKD